MTTMEKKYGNIMGHISMIFVGVLSFNSHIEPVFQVLSMEFSAVNFWFALGVMGDVCYLNSIQK